MGNTLGELKVSCYLHRISPLGRCSVVGVLLSCDSKLCKFPRTDFNTLALVIYAYVIGILNLSKVMHIQKFQVTAVPHAY